MTCLWRSAEALREAVRLLVIEELGLDADGIETFGQLVAYLAARMDVRK